MKKCPKCEGVLKITHSYVVGPAGSTHRAVCVMCKCIFTLSTAVYCEDTGRGKGAYAVANKLRQESTPEEEQTSSGADS